MSATLSTMIPLGSLAPTFVLLDTVSNKKLSLQDLKSGTATVIFFICNHCPFVVHINEELVKLANDYMHKGVSFIAISSNDIENYPADAPDKMSETAKKENYPSPICMMKLKKSPKHTKRFVLPIFLFSIKI